jgi:hypothetical protein
VGYDQSTYDQSTGERIGRGHGGDPRRWWSPTCLPWALPPSTRLTYWHLALHSGGATILVAGFWYFETAWAIVGGTLVTVGALLFVLGDLHGAEPALRLDSRRGGGAASLVLLLALGWIGGTILGMLLRIVPFLVWLHRFRNRVRPQEKIPFLHEMFQPRWGWLAYLAWFPAVVALAAGVGWGQWLLCGAGALLGAVSLAGLGIALGQTLYHVRPGTPALFPGREG